MTMSSLPTLADSGYDRAGQGIKTPVKQPAEGQVLAPDNQVLQHPAALDPLPGRSGLRAAHRPLASPPTVTVSLDPPSQLAGVGGS